MLCSYGCEQEGVHQYKNKKWCCRPKKEQCPAFIQKRIEARKANGKPWHSAEGRQHISDSTKGRNLNDEWKTNISNALKGRQLGPQSADHKEKLSRARKGKEPWNKGLTIDDPRVSAYATKQAGQKRKGNYVSQTGWQGAGNPWFGRNRSKGNSPRYKGEARQRELKNYYNKVTYLTEQVYKQFKDQINPTNYPRSLAGTEDGYHLDHIYPVAAGYENDIPPELLAIPENLQMIPWKDNVIKSNKIEKIPETIEEFLKENNMKQKSIYLLAQYISKPKDPHMTRIPGYITNPENLSYDEAVSFTVGLKDRDIIKSNVILNISEGMVVRNTFNSGKSYDELFDYFNEAYPEYMKHFLVPSEPTQFGNTNDGDVQAVQTEEKESS